MRVSPDIVLVVSRIEICSDTRFTVAGEEFVVASSETDASGPPRLATLLEEAIYARLYTRARPNSIGPQDVSPRDFVARLSAANVGRGTFEPGWRLEFVDEDGRLAVSKQGLRLWVPPSWFLARDGAAAPGCLGRVLVGKEFRGLMPGFYVAIGDASVDEASDEAPDPLVRLYWHLQARSAPDAIHAVTLELNRSGVPFRMKVLSDPGTYVRADAGVLYVSKRHFLEAASQIARVYSLVRSTLGSEVPLFTRKLAPGLGLAEDPGGADLSFGQHRSRVIAGALWACHQACRSSIESRIAETISAFAREGLDAARPHLGRGTEADYAPLPLRHRMSAATGPARRP